MLMEDCFVLRSITQLNIHMLYAHIGGNTMIDKDKLKKGITECYRNSNNGKLNMFVDIIWNIANGTWDANPQIVYHDITCQDCLFLHLDDKYGYVCAHNRRERDTIICEQFKMKGVKYD